MCPVPERKRGRHTRVAAYSRTWAIVHYYYAFPRKCNIQFTEGARGVLRYVEYGQPENISKDSPDGTSARRGGKAIGPANRAAAIFNACCGFNLG